jgi:serine/threonine-protein kinase
VSPDGRYVAVEGVESGTGTDIWIHDTQRPVKTRLTLDPARDSRPYWSPDGKQILFWSNRTGNVDAFIQDAGGASNAEMVSADPWEDYPNDWSPDGKFLMFGDGGMWYLRRAPGGNWEKGPPLHLPIDAEAAQFSPDGRFVAYVSRESGRPEVYVQHFPEPGRKWQVSLGGGDKPRWSKGGKELFYVNGDTLFAVPVTTRPDFSAGAPTRLFSDANLDWGYVHPSYDASADGRRFVLIEPVGPVSESAIWVVQNWFAEFRDRKPAPR